MNWGAQGVCGKTPQRNVARLTQIRQAAKQWIGEQRERWLQLNWHNSKANNVETHLLVDIEPAFLWSELLFI